MRITGRILLWCFRPAGLPSDAAMRHVRRHDDVSCDADVSPPKPVRDDRAAGDSATRRLPDRL